MLATGSGVNDMSPTYSATTDANSPPRLALR